MSSKRPPGEPPELTGYDYVRLLGSGGFADVFLYGQHLPRRNVAVKVMTEEAAEGQSREQFTAEANLMAQLSSHSSIVSIYHAGTSPDGRPFLVMQYCPLPNLAERTRRRPLGVAESVGIGVRLAGALETAHRAGIVHRDIKPANVLTTEYGRPALTDFGIAGLLSNTLTETAGLSIPWAPPEAIEGQVTGVAGDVYSLGATIFTLLVGRSPFTRPGGPNTRLDYTTRIRRDPVPRIQREDMPESLQRVLDKAMAKQIGQRFTSAADLGRALQAVEQEMRLPMTEIEMPDTSWMAPDPQDRRRAPRAALRAEGSARSGDQRGSADSSPTGGAVGTTGASGTSAPTGTAATSGPSERSAGSSAGSSQPSGASPDLSAAPPPTPASRAEGPAQPTQHRDDATRANPVHQVAHGRTGGPVGPAPGTDLPGASSPNQAAWAGSPQGPAPTAHSGAGAGPAFQSGPGAQHMALAGARPDTGTGRRRTGKGVLITAVACVAAVVAALVWSIGQLMGDVDGAPGSTNDAGRSDPGDTTTIAMPAQVAAPVDLVGTRAGEQVTFTWGVPSDLEASDVTFVWQRTGGQSLQPVDEPEVSFTEPGEVCIDVKIRLANGRTSNEAATTCVGEEA